MQTCTFETCNHFKIFIIITVETKNNNSNNTLPWKDAETPFLTVKSLWKHLFFPWKQLFCNRPNTVETLFCSFKPTVKTYPFSSSQHIFCHRLNTFLCHSKATVETPFFSPSK